MTTLTPRPAAADSDKGLSESDGHAGILSHWINGAPVAVRLEQTGPVYNPATGASSPAFRAAGPPK